MRKKRFIFWLIAQTLLTASLPTHGDTAIKFGSRQTPNASNAKIMLDSDSTYIPMRDGVHIAADVIYPKNEQKQFPTVVWFSRYWRSLALWLPSPTDRAPINPRGDLPDYFLKNGYAVVMVDVRGTGASDGQWTMPWSEDERNDYADVLNWVAQQPWSNGNIATTGISYDGSAAAFAAASNVKALKAIIPRQIEFDVYPDVVAPGGIFNDWFVKSWSNGNKQLDSDKTADFFPWIARLVVTGVRPVQGNKEKLKQIIASRNNNDVYASLKHITFRDDPYGSSGISLSEFSVFTHGSAIEKSGVPIFSWGSWMDGGTADTVIRQFINFSNPQYAVIGAWDHIIEHQGSPYGDSSEPAEPDLQGQWQEMRDFIDSQLRENPPKEIGKKIIYYTMGEEKWKQTDSWPPANSTEQVFYFSDSNRLMPDVPAEKTAFDRYKIDFNASTGTNNRWHTELAKEVDYGNRAKKDKQLLTYTSEPLVNDLEITGYPIIELAVQSTHTDGAFYVYLEDVFPDGRVTYITDGQLRALHRKLSEEKPPYKSFGPYHSFKRKDALPLVTGETTQLRFSLQPTSVLVRKGHRIRVAIAGHDSDTFVRIPETGDPEIKVFRDAISHSSIVLPVIK